MADPIIIQIVVEGADELKKIGPDIQSTLTAAFVASTGAAEQLNETLGQLSETLTKQVEVPGGQGRGGEHVDELGSKAKASAAGFDLLKASIDGAFEVLTSGSASTALTVVRDVGEAAEHAGTSWGGLGAILGTTAGRFAAISTAIAGTVLAGHELANAVADDVIELTDLSRVGGTSTAQILAIRHAFGEAGVGANETNSIFRSLAIRAQDSWNDIKKAQRDAADSMQSDRLAIADAATAHEQAIVGTNEAQIKLAEAQENMKFSGVDAGRAVSQAIIGVKTAAEEAAEAITNLHAAQAGVTSSGLGVRAADISAKIEDLQWHAFATGDRPDRSVMRTLQFQQREVQHEQAQAGPGQARLAQERAIEAERRAEINVQRQPLQQGAAAETLDRAQLAQQLEPQKAADAFREAVLGVSSSQTKLQESIIALTAAVNRASDNYNNNILAIEATIAGRAGGADLTRSDPNAVARALIARGGGTGAGTLQALGGRGGYGEQGFPNLEAVMFASGIPRVDVQRLVGTFREGGAANLPSAEQQRLGAEIDASRPAALEQRAARGELAGAIDTAKLEAGMALLTTDAAGLHDAAEGVKTATSAFEEALRTGTAALAPFIALLQRATGGTPGSAQGGSDWLTLSANIAQIASLFGAGAGISALGRGAASLAGRTLGVGTQAIARAEGTAAVAGELAPSLATRAVGAVATSGVLLGGAALLAPAAQGAHSTAEIPGEIASDDAERQKIVSFFRSIASLIPGAGVAAPPTGRAPTEGAPPPARIPAAPVETAASAQMIQALNANTAALNAKTATEGKKEEKAAPVSGLAEGGLVEGPGGPTDDRVPIRASAGEYIVQAARVQEHGVGALDAFNEGRIGFSVGGVAGGADDAARFYEVSHPPGHEEWEPQGAPPTRDVDNTVTGPRLPRMRMDRDAEFQLGWKRNRLERIIEEHGGGTRLGEGGLVGDDDGISGFAGGGWMSAAAAVGAGSSMGDDKKETARDAAESALEQSEILGGGVGIGGIVAVGSEVGNKEVLSDPKVQGRLKASDERKQKNFAEHGALGGAWKNLRESFGYADGGPVLSGQSTISLDYLFETGRITQAQYEEEKAKLPATPPIATPATSAASTSGGEPSQRAVTSSKPVVTRPPTADAVTGRGSQDIGDRVPDYEAWLSKIGVHEQISDEAGAALNARGFAEGGLIQARGYAEGGQVIGPHHVVGEDPAKDAEYMEDYAGGKRVIGGASNEAGMAYYYGANWRSLKWGVEPEATGGWKAVVTDQVSKTGTATHLPAPTPSPLEAAAKIDVATNVRLAEAAKLDVAAIPPQSASVVLPKPAEINPAVSSQISSGGQIEGELGLVSEAQTAAAFAAYAAHHPGSSPQSEPVAEPTKPDEIARPAAAMAELAQLLSPTPAGDAGKLRELTPIAHPAAAIARQTGTERSELMGFGLHKSSDANSGDITGIRVSGVNAPATPEERGGGPGTRQGSGQGRGRGDHGQGEGAGKAKDGASHGAGHRGSGSSLGQSEGAGTGSDGGSDGGAGGTGRRRGRGGGGRGRSHGDDQGFAGFDVGDGLGKATGTGRLDRFVPAALREHGAPPPEARFLDEPMPGAVHRDRSIDFAFGGLVGFFQGGGPIDSDDLIRFPQGGAALDQASAAPIEAHARGEAAVERELLGKAPHAAYIEPTFHSAAKAGEEAVGREVLGNVGSVSPEEAASHALAKSRPVTNVAQRLLGRSLRLAGPLGSALSLLIPDEPLGDDTLSRRPDLWPAPWEKPKAPTVPQQQPAPQQPAKEVREAAKDNLDVKLLGEPFAAGGLIRLFAAGGAVEAFEAGRRPERAEHLDDEPGGASVTHDGEKLNIRFAMGGEAHHEEPHASRLRPAMMEHEPHSSDLSADSGGEAFAAAYAGGGELHHGVSHETGEASFLKPAMMEHLPGAGDLSEDRGGETFAAAYAFGGKVDGEPIRFFPGGGQTSGPGGWTGDKIPAWLSDGEFVVKAERVAEAGVENLHAFNEGRIGFAAEGGYFADGGPVDLSWMKNVSSAISGDIDPASVSRVRGNDRSDDGFGSVHHHILDIRTDNTIIKGLPVMSETIDSLEKSAMGGRITRTAVSPTWRGWSGS